MCCQLGFNKNSLGKATTKSGISRKLVRAEFVRCPWLLAQTKVATIFITFSSEYNHTEPEYNHTEPEYNHAEPEYNHTEPEYNHTEPVPYLKTP